ncbi:hypothetical protein GY45DRAFT_1078847 [Cubamyces sp. BRFM 1775]|nr:hypothetical protein GY45DRAFT_1078847 [Cubamyces sp. BRFM 1775]
MDYPSQPPEIVEVDLADWQDDEFYPSTVSQHSDEQVSPSKPCPLDSLPYEIMEEIAELLFVTPGQRHFLKLFSLTCKRIRRLCAPILFRSIMVSIEYKLLPGRVFHDTGKFWLYVKQLILCGSWEADYLGPSVKHHGASFLLKKLVSRLSHLNTLFVTGFGRTPIPADISHTLLSIPTLSSFILQTWENSPHPLLAIDAHPFTTTFTSFEYRVPELARSKSVLNGEWSVLEFVTTQMSSSLVRLTLPVGVISFSAISRTCWPNLRELNLEGDCELGHGQTVDIGAVLSGMPFLRSLRVSLPQGSKSHRVVMQRARQVASFPCQDLEDLTVSFPDPDDVVYSQLPPTLRRLALRCTPRHYNHRYRFEQKTLMQLGLRSPILTAFELLSVLRRCRSELLQELELEYEEDERDEELLTNISTYFPALRILTLYRYRRRDSEVDLSAVELAQALSPLRSLRMLRLHLDHSNAPHPLSAYMPDVPPGAWCRHAELLTKTAYTLAARLASLEFVCMLSRKRWSNRWLPYRVLRSQGMDTAVELDELIPAIGHLSMLDENGPRTRAQYPALEELDYYEF